MSSGVRCPICKRPVSEPPAPDAQRTFPFCTERCKLVDLGRWLDGKYQIPVSDADEGSDEQRQPSDSDEPN